jgi:hypothetical protein
MGREFVLGEEEFYNLTQMPCHYCGAVRTNRRFVPHNLYGDFRYNGIDRVDNSRGYTPDNVVPCCRHCNMAKGRTTYQEFIKWIKALVRHHNKRPRDPNRTDQSGQSRQLLFGMFVVDSGDPALGNS